MRVDEAEARQKIHDLLVTGDNRLKQGVSPEKIRQSYEQALARRDASTGSRTRSGRSSRSGSPTSNGSLEDLLHPSRLRPDVVRRRGGARGARSATAATPRSRARARARRRRAGRRARPPRRRRTRAGRRCASRRRLRSHAIASSSAWPNGSIKRRPADDVGRAQPARHLVVRDAADDAHAVAPLELRPQRAVADERQRAAAELRERVGEPHDVLALRQRADVHERRDARARPPAPTAANRSRSTPESTTSVFPRASGSRSSSSRRR